jgi:hypothetical protein
VAVQKVYMMKHSVVRMRRAERMRNYLGQAENHLNQTNNILKMASGKSMQKGEGR